VPSQTPLWPQETLPSSVQVLRGSGAPAGTSTHCPGDPGSAQLRQAPWQLLSQQTPSTHSADSHSVASPQDWPFFFLPQLPVTPGAPVKTHAWPVAQSASLEHAPLHAPVVQRYGEQSTNWAAWQLPFPSQARAVLRRVDPLQEVAPHGVVSG